MSTNLKIKGKILAALTDDERWFLWEKALSAEGKSLKETLIEENMHYLKWSREKVLSYWGVAGTQKIKENWIKENPKTKKEINEHYNKLYLYIPELSSWHAIEKNIDLIKAVEFLQFCARNNLRSYLDFGAGIGSAALFFAYYGFSVSCADISNSMLGYSRWRFKRHHAKAHFIDLKKNKLPENKFDCVMSMEVLEHVPDPIETVNNIRLSLKPGGYLFVTTPFLKDEERPQHLVHDMRIADQFEKIGFIVISVSKNKIYRIYKRIK